MQQWCVEQENYPPEAVPGNWVELVAPVCVCVRVCVCVCVCVCVRVCV